MKQWKTLIFAIGVIFVVTLWGVWDLRKPGLPTGHDSGSHISRMIEFEEAIAAGQWMPRWAGGLYQGMGSPVLILNYQLPYWLGYGLRLMGFSLFDTYKLLLAGSFIISGLLMMLVMRRLCGTLPGMLSGVLYAIAPYRFLNVYVRSALGESMAFLFPPLILWGIWKEQRVLTTLSWTFLFLTHPVASAVVSAFMLGVALLRASHQRTFKPLRFFSTTYIVAMLLASFNIVPTLALTQFTNYSPTNSHPLNHFPTVSQLIYSPWGYGFSTEDSHDQMSYQVGAVHWIILALGIMVIAWYVVKIIRSKNSYKLSETDLLIVWCVFTAGVTIAMMTSASQPLWKLTHLFVLIDFPWRLLMVPVIACSILGGLVVARAQRILPQHGWFLIPMLILGVIIANRNHIRINQVWPWGEEHYYEDRGTGDAFGEYTPKWRQRWTATEYDRRVEVIGGTAALGDIYEKPGKISTSVMATTSAFVRFNILYFPGWMAHIDSRWYDPRQGWPCSISARVTPTQDDSGLIVCWVESGSHELTAQFQLTGVEYIGRVMSVGGLLVIIWWLFPLSFQPLMKQVQSTSFFRRWLNTSRLSKKRTK